MEAELSEITIEALLYREIEKVAFCKWEIFKEKNMIFPYPNGQTREILLIPV